MASGKDDYQSVGARWRIFKYSTVPHMTSKEMSERILSSLRSLDDEDEGGGKT